MYKLIVLAVLCLAGAHATNSTGSSSSAAGGSGSAAGGSGAAAADKAGNNLWYDRTMTQKITFAKLDSAKYTANAKKVYQLAYASTVGIASISTGKWKDKCSTTSTAAAIASGRRSNSTANSTGSGGTITFVSKVASTLIVEVKTLDTYVCGKGFLGCTFIDNFKKANTLLKLTETVPLEADITVAKSTWVTHNTGVGKDLEDAAAAIGTGLLIAIIVISVLVVGGIIGCVYCCLKKPKETVVVMQPQATPMEGQHVVTVAQPAGAKYMKNGVWYNENDQPCS